MSTLHYILGILLIPFSYAWHGFVLAKLWLWFLVPTFALPVLSVPVAIGIGTVSSLLTHQVPNKKPGKPAEELEAFKRAVVGAFLFPALALLTGTIVKAFL